MDVGRNDPCPCGSGKKHKRCCGAVTRVDALEAAATAWRAAQDAVEPKILRFLRQSFGEDALDKASDDFGLPHAGPRGEDVESQLFFPWFLYDWRRDALAAPGPGAVGDTIPPARRYLAERGDRLAEKERRFLDVTSSTPTSFHEVLGSEPGRSLRLRDVLLGTEAMVFERSGSQLLREGDLTFARVVAFEDAALMVGCGGILLPPIEKGVVLDLRASLRTSFRTVSADLLRRIEPQLREYYFTIRRRLLEPVRPQMCNTDGDPMEFHTLKYQVESADVAFEALRTLAAGTRREELLRDATVLPDGRLQSVAFSWSKSGNRMHASWDNTIVANIAIKDRELRVEVNSEKRAKQARAEVQRCLGTRALFLGDETKSLDGMMLEGDRHASTPAGKREAREQEALQQLPEVQEVMRRTMERHWESWIDEKIPALGGKTPKKAVRDTEGRERVEALLLQFERHDAGPSGAAQEPAYDFNRIRKRLGLPLRERTATPSRRRPTIET
jgi:hypothetical protein